MRSLPVPEGVLKRHCDAIAPIFAKKRMQIVQVGRQAWLSAACVVPPYSMDSAGMLSMTYGRRLRLRHPSVQMQRVLWHAHCCRLMGAGFVFMHASGHAGLVWLVGCNCG